MTTSRVVYLFRSGDESDPYEEAFAEQGYEAITVPVLEFRLINTKELRAALEHPRSYDGVILTSPRAVEAIAAAMPWLPTENVVWHSKAFFSVGPRTASELRQIGFEPTGEGSGSADMLAAHIAGCDFEKPLLFLSGNRRRDELPERLRREGIAMEELCVYESKPRARLELGSLPPADWVVFFSPSGLEAIRSGEQVDLSSVRVAAIGETTAAALNAEGVGVDAIANEPTPDALVQAVSAADGIS